MPHRSSCCRTPLPPLVWCPATLLWMRHAAFLVYLHTASLLSSRRACAGYCWLYSSAQVHRLFTSISAEDMTKVYWQHRRGRMAKTTWKTFLSWIILPGKKLLQIYTSLCPQNGSRVEDLTAWPCQIKGKEGREKEFLACIQPLPAGGSVRADMQSGCNQAVQSCQGDREDTDLMQSKVPCPIRRKMNPCHSGRVPSLQGFSQWNQRYLE